MLEEVDVYAALRPGGYKLKSLLLQIQHQVLGGEEEVLVLEHARIAHHGGDAASIRRIGICSHEWSQIL